jgi:hypothetical protein
VRARVPAVLLAQILCLVCIGLHCFASACISLHRFVWVDLVVSGTTLASLTIRTYKDYLEEHAALFMGQCDYEVAAAPVAAPAPAPTTGVSAGAGAGATSGATASAGAGAGASSDVVDVTGDVDVTTVAPASKPLGVSQRPASVLSVLGPSLVDLQRGRVSLRGVCVCARVQGKASRKRPASPSRGVPEDSGVAAAGTPAPTGPPSPEDEEIVDHEARPRKRVTRQVASEGEGSDSEGQGEGQGDAATTGEPLDAKQASSNKCVIC